MSFVAVVLGLAFAIPVLLSADRALNEWQASDLLKTLTSAEADFRANDRDLNKVNDFWTGDISGLYTVKPTANGAQIRMIEESLANADARPLFSLGKGAVPKGSYFFQALDRDDSVPGEKGIYRVDTDKSGWKVHNESKFGFCAFPKTGRDGKYVFFTNQANTIFRTREMGPRTSFPSDQELIKITGGD